MFLDQVKITLSLISDYQIFYCALSNHYCYFSSIQKVLYYCFTPTSFFFFFVVEFTLGISRNFFFWNSNNGICVVSSLTGSGNKHFLFSCQSVNSDSWGFYKVMSLSTLICFIHLGNDTFKMLQKLFSSLSHLVGIY